MVLAPSSAAGGLAAGDPPSLVSEGGKVPVVAGLDDGYYRTGGEVCQGQNLHRACKICGG